MTFERALQIAIALQRLGVSPDRCGRLMKEFSYDAIEQQLAWLPYRKAKRPAAFIIDAIRFNYSAPKDAFYAPPQTDAQAPDGSVDQAAQQPN